MKKRISAIFSISAALLISLTACTATESELPMLEVQSTPTASKPEQTPAAESSDDSTLPTTAAPESTAATTVPAQTTTTAPPDYPELPEQLSVIDLLADCDDSVYIRFDPQYITPLDDENLCILYRIPAAAPNDSIPKTAALELGFFNVSSGKQIKHVTLPEVDYLCDIDVRKGGTDKDDLLTIVTLTSGYHIDGSYQKKITVKKDYTYKVHEPIIPESYTFPVGSRSVSQSGYNLYDAATAKLLVQGVYHGGDNLANEHPRCTLAIDDNRFVYTVGGWEWIYGIGICDMSTGTAALVPDSRDFYPVGMHNGKLYSARYYDGGADTTIYVTDPSTLKTTTLFDEFALPVKPEHWHVCMPEGGDFIMVGTEQVFFLDPDTAEVIAAYDLRAIGRDFASTSTFIIGDRYAGFLSYNEGLLYILDLSEQAG